MALRSCDESAFARNQRICGARSRLVDELLIDPEEEVHWPGPEILEKDNRNVVDYILCWVDITHVLPGVGDLVLAGVGTGIFCVAGTNAWPNGTSQPFCRAGPGTQ